MPCSITRKGNRGGHRSLLYPHMETYNKERIDWEKIKKGIDNMFPPKRDTASEERKDNPYPLDDTETKKRVMERYRKRKEKLKQ